MSKISPAERIAEYKEKAVAAKTAGDLQAAADWYYKAARLADFESASEYARITFPHIYDPIPNPKKAAANGKKICKWENHTYSKLNMKLYRERSEEIKFQKRLEAHQKIAAKYDHPMVDRLFGSFYDAYCGFPSEAEAYYKKAAERGDYVAAYCLVLLYGRNKYETRRGIFRSVQDMEQFWKLWHGHPEFVNEKLDQIDRDLNDPTTELYKEHQEWWARIRPQLAAYMGEDWVKANCKE